MVFATLVAFFLSRAWPDPFVVLFRNFVYNRGWLRADSLEELVGLDVSYHGRSTHGENGDIKKEYIEAYNRYKGAIRQSGRHGHNNTNPDREQLPFAESQGNVECHHSASSASPSPYHQDLANTISRTSGDHGDEHTEEVGDSSDPTKEESAPPIITND